MDVLATRKFESARNACAWESEGMVGFPSEGGRPNV